MALALHSFFQKCCIETRKKGYIHYRITNLKNLSFLRLLRFFVITYVVFFYGFVTSYILGQDLKLFWYLLDHNYNMWLNKVLCWLSFSLHYFRPQTLISKLIKNIDNRKLAANLSHRKICTLNYRKKNLQSVVLICIAPQHRIVVFLRYKLRRKSSMRLPSLI